PCLRPVVLGDGRDGRAAGARETQRVQRAEIDVHTLHDRAAVRDVGEERAQMREARWLFFFDDAEGPELPDEIRETFGCVGRYGDREFPVTGTHAQPSSFFILSMKALASGPRCSFDAASNASRASRCVALSFCGTSRSSR